MIKVLRLTSSILGEHSVSTQLTDTVIESMRAAHGKEDGVDVVERDLSATPIPHVDNAWLQALMTPEADRNDEQQAKVAFSDSLIAELQQADLLLIALPMYNFSVPSMLKAWNDHVARAGVTFKYTEQGSQGLLDDKQALLVATMGGDHDNDGGDFLRPYMKHFLGFLGIDKVDIISASGLNLGDEPRQQAISKARQDIKRWASQSLRDSQTKEQAA